jgi:peroxiredoxin
MLELGAKAPDFGDLQGADGKRYTLRSFDDKPVLVVIFTCNHCPYAVAYEDREVAIQRDYAPRGVQLVGINSNDDKAYPEDGYPQMVKRAKEKGFNFPYVRDATQKAAEAYGAVCTRTRSVKAALICPSKSSPCPTKRMLSSSAQTRVRGISLPSGKRSILQYADTDGMRLLHDQAGRSGARGVEFGSPIPKMDRFDSVG